MTPILLFGVLGSVSSQPPEPSTVPSPLTDPSTVPSPLADSSTVPSPLADPNIEPRSPAPPLYSHLMGPSVLSGPIAGVVYERHVYESDKQIPTNVAAELKKLHA